MSLFLKFIPVFPNEKVSIQTKTIETDSFQRENISFFEFNVTLKNIPLIFETLQQIGAEEVLHNPARNWVLFKIDGIFMRLSPNNSQFILDIYNNISSEQANELLNELEEQYLIVLQNKVYERVKANAEEKGLTLENEIFQNDQTIVLTYTF